MKRVFLLIHFFLLLPALALDDFQEGVAKRLRGMEGMREISVYLREIQSLSVPERKRVLDTSELLVSMEANPFSSIIGNAIVIWMELREEERLIRSLVPRIEKAGDAPREDIADALAICQAPEAAKAMAAMARSLMNRVAASATAAKDDDSGHRFGDEAILFLHMIHKMAASSSPHTQAELERIKTDFFTRSQEVQRMRDLVPYLSQPLPEVVFPEQRAAEKTGTTPVETTTSAISAVPYGKIGIWIGLGAGVLLLVIFLFKAGK